MSEHPLLIYNAEHFDVFAHEHPHIDRVDGGHVVIAPKEPVEDRTHLTPTQAVELMKLTMVTGEAMKTVLNKHGIDLARINYQDNGNWKQQLHIHLYGRARSAKIQPWGAALQFPATQEAFLKAMGGLTPLTHEDVRAMHAEIERLLATDKYRSF